MIAVDTNLLIYAHRPDSVFHAKAHPWLKQRCEGRQPWAIPWPCIHEFIGHVTNARIYRNPTPIRDALSSVDALIASPSLVLLHENEDYWSEFSAIVTSAAVTGARVHDAKIAALVRAHGVAQLATCDRDFSRFAGISLINPLHDDRANEGSSRRRRRTRTA
jgi:uncharacterized protein